MSWELTDSDMAKIHAIMWRKASMFYRRHDQWDIAYLMERMWDVVALALESYDPAKGCKLSTWILTKMQWALVEEKRRQYDISLSEDHRGFARETATEHYANTGEHLLIYEPAFETSVFWQEVVETLTPALQGMLRLLLQGYTMPEAAEALGITKSAAYVRVHAIRKKLKEKGIRP